MILVCWFGSSLQEAENERTSEPPHQQLTALSLAIPGHYDGAKRGESCNDLIATNASEGSDKPAAAGGLFSLACTGTVRFSLHGAPYPVCARQWRSRRALDHHAVA